MPIGCFAGASQVYKASLIGDPQRHFALKQLRSDRNGVDSYKSVEIIDALKFFKNDNFDLIKAVSGSFNTRNTTNAEIAASQPAIATRSHHY